MEMKSNNPIDDLYSDHGIVVETELERLRRLEMASAMITQVKPDKTKYNRKEKHRGDYETE